MSGNDALHAAALRSFDRRIAPSEHLASYADEVARACHDMAGRFLAGGKLLVFGNGGPATDAQHIAVEFVHPVIVGKRALPALSLVGDVATVMGVASRHGIDAVFAHQLRVLGAAEDIALGVSGDGNCVNVLRGIEVAHEAGLLTVALVGGDGGKIAASPAVDHCFIVDSTDSHIVKEVHVTTVAPSPTATSLRIASSRRHAIVVRCTPAQGEQPLAGQKMHADEVHTDVKSARRCGTRASASSRSTEAGTANQSGRQTASCSSSPACKPTQARWANESRRRRG